MTYGRRSRRPFGVTVLGLLIVLGGILDVVAGVALVVSRNNADVRRDTGASAQTLLTIGIVAIVIGVLYLLVARGLFRGGGIARLLVGLVSLMNVVGGLFTALSNSGNLRAQGIGAAVVGLVVLLLLYSPKANAFFRTN